MKMFTKHYTLAMAFVLAGVVFLHGSAFAKAEQLPPRQWTPAERKQYEEKVDWLYRAKYGIMFHFVPNMHRFRTGRIKWTGEKWSAWIDAVDVEKIAAQAAEIGAGYVILSIGQGGGFYCAPNPVIRKYWGLKPGEAGSKRDLPMDLYGALNKRGIRMMLYTGCAPSLMPGPASEKVGWFGSGFKFDRCTPEGAAHWAEALQWYSDHYGEKVSGWWLDGLREWAPGYRKAVHAAIAQGNPNALATSGTYALSDFLHGHCVADWKKQQRRLPTQGRWDATYQIQWHAFQYLGRSWSARGTAHSSKSIVEYATEVIKRGGVITFDIGTFDERPKIKGPYLYVPEDQMNQLRAVRDAVRQVRRAGGQAVSSE